MAAARNGDRSRARADDQFIANAAFSVSAKLPGKFQRLLYPLALGPFACLICARRRCFERRDRHLGAFKRLLKTAQPLVQTRLFDFVAFFRRGLAQRRHLTDGQALLGDGQLGFDETSHRRRGRRRSRRRRQSRRRRRRAGPSIRCRWKLRIRRRRRVWPLRLRRRTLRVASLGHSTWRLGIVRRCL